MTCFDCECTSKYKCPTCQIPYCSVACYKVHKETPCIKPPSPQRELDIVEERTTEYEYPTEDTVPLEKLKLLQQSTELKNCLADPYVLELLETLDKTSNPDSLFQEFMQIPVFTEFVHICTNIVQDPEKDSR